MTETESSQSAGRRPLVLSPFRGLRFNPETVGDLGTVVSPPYDVLDASIVHALEQANRHNVVRLILSRYAEPPYQAVRRRLERWRDRGYLVADRDPALYLYTYTADGRTVRGLVGLLDLREEAERVVLPHEDVMPGPVDDRALLMRTTETNLEPILLVHADDPTLLALYDRVSEQPPESDFTALDGSTHRLWRMTHAADIAAVAEALGPHQALIADGHHRYAAYLRLQQERGADAGSPWASGLAMLVADEGQALQVRPIHRVVTGLTLGDVEESCAERGDTFVSLADRHEADAHRAALVEPAGAATFWLSDGTRWAFVQTPRRAVVDTAVLHDELLPAWHVDDHRLTYHHSLDQALGVTGAGEPAVVVLVRPPTLADVRQAAANGVRLPRKSTSFAPKPRMGVVMRDLRDS